MYISYYGLKAEPFLLTPDPQFLHLSETHQTALTVVVEGILYRKGLVMITGPIGTGKTTILHAALQMLTDASKEQMPIRSAFLFNPTLSPDEFFEMMLDDFKVVCSSTSKASRLLALYQMLMGKSKRKNRLQRAPGREELVEIGEITRDKRIVLSTDPDGRIQPLKPQGWDPFGKR